VLAQAAQVGPLPLYWLSQLQAAEKDSTAVLAALRALEPNQILPALYFTPDMPDPVRQILRDVQQGARPSPREMDVLKADLLRINRPAPARVIETMLSAWARSAEYGEAYLDALETYANNFFLEEEQRLTPLIRKGQSHARDLAEQMDFVGLIEELTQGLHIEALQQVERVVLAPSFWSNPLIFYWLNAPRQAVLLFGFRPHTQQLVPGESVPESTLNVLKALADPTRLKILRYLGENRRPDAAGSAPAPASADRDSSPECAAGGRTGAYRCAGGRGTALRPAPRRFGGYLGESQSLSARSITNRGRDKSIFGQHCFKVISS
jgi:DNA-binding transcriptional ArsR family regulator